GSRPGAARSRSGGRAARRALASAGQVARRCLGIRGGRVRVAVTRLRERKTAMSEELKKAEYEGRQARYAAWQRMAKTLPNHHILAVEMFRTENDHTLAVFTVVRDGEPVQEILRANSRGTDVHAVVPKHQDECKPIRWWPFSPFH